MLRTQFWLLLYKCLTWLALSALVAALPLLSWFRPKFSKWVRMRFWPKPLGFQPELWVHAVSMGEIKIARALLEVNGRPPAGSILLTTSTQSGYRMLSETFGKDSVRYLPWDTGFSYRRLFGPFTVPNLIVVETEIWPCLFDFVHDGAGALVIVNGRLSSRTMRMKKNPLFRRALGRVTKIFARSDLDADRFREFGVDPDRVRVTGNMKFDFKPALLEHGRLYDWLDRPGKLVIFASVSSDEIDLLAPGLAALLHSLPDLRVLWVPRHLRDLEQHRQGLAAFEPGLRSRLDEEETASSSRFLILDSFGELSALYGFADLSLVGGSFNQRGGQNFLESLQAGTPAVMGPSTENFHREVAEAQAEGVIICLKSPQEVAQTVLDLLGDTVKLKEMSRRARGFLAKHSGAIGRTSRELIKLKFFRET